MVLNFGTTCAEKHVRCLLCPDNLRELGESCSTNMFGAKVISNQGMDLTVADAIQFFAFYRRRQCSMNHGWFAFRGNRRSHQTFAGGKNEKRTINDSGGKFNTGMWIWMPFKQK